MSLIEDEQPQGGKSSLYSSTVTAPIAASELEQCQFDRDSLKQQCSELQKTVDQLKGLNTEIQAKLEISRKNEEKWEKDNLELKATIQKLEGSVTQAEEKTESLQFLYQQTLTQLSRLKIKTEVPVAKIDLKEKLTL